MKPRALLVLCALVLAGCATPRAGEPPAIVYPPTHYPAPR